VPFLTYHDGEQVQRFEISRKLCGIGRAGDNDLAISDPGIEPYHAQILRDGKTWVLTSLDPDAVLLVNGRDRRNYSLKDGDLLLMGGTELAFSLTAPGTEASARPRKATAKAEVASIDPRLKKITTFAEKLLLGMEVPEIFKTLLDAVIALCGASKGFLIHVDGDTIYIPAARNIDRVDVGSDRAQVSDSVIARVLKERRPIIISDALNDTVLGQSKSVLDLRLSSVMCVPLMARNNLIGVLYLGNEGLEGLFTLEDLELLKIFAAQAGLILHNALLLDELRLENEDLARDVQAGTGLGGTMIGNDPSMVEVFRTISKVAPTDLSVLVTGETGTGKELVARETHQRSNRREAPFVSINCGAIPENLLESELFGHKKGAFTGAISDKQGKFEDANGGTLFLDEIGEMPMNLQVKLLRVLQEREIERVGEGKARAVDIRVVSATNKDLSEEITAGRFREDLFYRLNELVVSLPPLRDRGDDVILISKHLLKRFSRLYSSKAGGFSLEALEALRTYVWPGNVRQLENRIKKALVLSEGAFLGPMDLGFTGEQPEAASRWQALAEAKESFQQRYIKDCLEAHAWNKAATARALDVDPRTIFRYIEKLKDD
jgi:transcriptional regulator with GAF, ATPase, and Fis domain